ncbi:MAG: GFA family protein [Casimicrobiaceae bacterium]
MFRTRASIKTSQFSWIKGQELLKTYHSSVFTAKHFCSVCGSNLVSTYDNDPSRVSIPLGGQDQVTNNQLEGHFFVGSKAPWFEITDGLPQYETWPGSRTDVRKTSGEV